MNTVISRKRRPCSSLFSELKDRCKFFQLADLSACKNQWAHESQPLWSSWVRSDRFLGTQAILRDSMYRYKINTCNSELFSGNQVSRVWGQTDFENYCMKFTYIKSLEFNSSIPHCINVLVLDFSFFVLEKPVS